MLRIQDITFTCLRRLVFRSFGEGGKPRALPVGASLLGFFFNFPFNASYCRESLFSPGIEGKFFFPI